MNCTQIKTCLFFMALFFCNYAICDEEAYGIDILSMTTKKDSYEILGSINDGKNVEWVALHSKLENHFSNQKIDQHDVFLYNVNDRLPLIWLGVHRDIDLFDIHKEDQKLNVIFRDQDSEGTYIFSIDITTRSKKIDVKIDKNYRIFDDKGGIIEQNEASVFFKERNLIVEDGDPALKLIGYRNGDEEYLLFKKQTHIFRCPIKNNIAKCEKEMPFLDYILERGNIIIKNDTAYTFIPEKKAM